MVYIPFILFLALNVLKIHCEIQGNIVPFIVKGEEAKAHEFPYIISIQTNRHICGGTIIDDTTILTAAHCLYKASEGAIESSYSIYAGSHDITKPEKEKRQIVSVRKRIMHPNFKTESIDYDHDIALLKLKNKLKFNNYVKTVQLPKQDQEPSGSLKVIGWGSTIYNNPSASSPVLKKLDLNFEDHSYCSEIYVSRAKVTGNMVCAWNGYLGNVTGDACTGDSGGPLLCIENGKVTQCGIVSFAQGCESSVYPGVYTKLSKYIDWINKSKIVEETTTEKTSSKSSKIFLFKINLLFSTALHLYYIRIK